ncbi:LamG-like jellyroll fold domain-containing protein [Krasilnikovia sp. MM14-A1259]|uniref:LamG-like jellyroll fold domain-containing protein n=1 Tax=Krasilnikovia sp. MM14-A1259 TaxID=3373539 RepID=UPI003830C423
MRHHSYTLAAAAAACLLLTSAPAQAQRPIGEPAGAPAPTGQDATGFVARYGFDTATGNDDSGNGHTLRLVARHRGTVRAIAHNTGRGIEFPARCSGGRCPHAVLQARSSAALNPGFLPLAFGATVLLPPAQTSSGQNIVQKGYSRTSSQYKLQVDGAAGRPSCVLVGVLEPRIRMARSRISIADGRWHTLQCERRGGWLRIIVDGVVQGQRRVPPLLTVVNWCPLSIGGKGAYADNDQFHGGIDDVWVRIG